MQVINAYKKYGNEPIKGTQSWIYLPEGYSNKRFKFKEGVGFTASEYNQHFHPEDRKYPEIVNYLFTIEEAEEIIEKEKRQFHLQETYGKASYSTNSYKEAKVFLMDLEWTYNLTNSLDYMNFLEKCRQLNLFV